MSPPKALKEGRGSLSVWTLLLMLVFPPEIFELKINDDIGKMDNLELNLDEDKYDTSKSFQKIEGPLCFDGTEEAEEHIYMLKGPSRKEINDLDLGIKFANA
jgi:hypothetical protein